MDNITENIKLSIENDKFILKDDYKQFSDDISKIYSDMTLFTNNITLETFKKIITSAIYKNSTDVMYTIERSENIHVVFRWKGVLDGKCEIIIPKEKITYDKNKLYKDIENIPSLIPVLNYIDCKLKELQTEKKIKVNITNKLIDFHTVTKLNMANHIKQYGINLEKSMYHLFVQDPDTIKVILLYHEIYSKFIANNTNNYEYNIVDKEIDYKTLDLCETNFDNYIVLRNLPNSDITLIYEKNKTIINGCIFINPNHYNYKESKLSLKKLFTTYTICKVNCDKILTSDIQQVSIQWTCTIPWKDPNPNIDVTTRILTTSGILQYKLYTECGYLYLKVLNVLSMKKENTSYDLYLIRNLNEFSRHTVPKNSNQRTGHYPIPIYQNNGYLITTSTYLTNSLMYFDFNHVILNNM